MHKFIILRICSLIVAVTETTAGNDYELAAEVGLLTRNIKIVCEDYADQEEELFGARVVVGKMTDGEHEQIGNEDCQFFISCSSRKILYLTSDLR